MPSDYKDTPPPSDAPAPSDAPEPNAGLSDTGLSAFQGSEPDEGIVTQQPEALVADVDNQVPNSTGDGDTDVQIDDPVADQNPPVRPGRRPESVQSPEKESREGDPTPPIEGRPPSMRRGLRF